MDSNAGINARRFLGMGWLWMVCFFHLVTSLEGKSRFYEMQEFNRFLSRGKKKNISVFSSMLITVKISIKQIPLCFLMVTLSPEI